MSIAWGSLLVVFVVTFGVAVAVVVLVSLRVGRAVRSYRALGRATRSCRCESQHGHRRALPAGGRRDHRFRCVHHRCLNRVSRAVRRA
jgi:hypothetical protein